MYILKVPYIVFFLDKMTNFLIQIKQAKFVMKCHRKIRKGFFMGKVRGKKSVNLISERVISELKLSAVVSTVTSAIRLQGFPLIRSAILFSAQVSCATFSICRQS